MSGRPGVDLAEVPNSVRLHCRLRASRGQRDRATKGEGLRRHPPYISVGPKVNRNMPAPPPPLQARRRRAALDKRGRERSRKGVSRSEASRSVSSPRGGLKSSRPEFSQSGLDGEGGCVGGSLFLPRTIWILIASDTAGDFKLLWGGENREQWCCRLFWNPLHMAAVFSAHLSPTRR